MQESIEGVIRTAVREEVAEQLRALADGLAAAPAVKRAPRVSARASVAPKTKRSKAAPESSKGSQGDRLCAVEGCDREARAKGYCSKHYQKLRMLQKSGRAEEFGWLEGLEPGSVSNPVLPRGRAAARAQR